MTACTSRINKTNFDRIQPGMTLAEVIHILGEPSSTATLGVGDIVGTTANWENRNGVISIQFFNGRVKIKKYIEGVSTPRVDS